MGGISRKRLSQYKVLLGLPDEALELADRHNVDERHLRYVLQLPFEVQSEAVRQIVTHNLDLNQLRRMIESGEEAVSSQNTPARHSLQLARLIQGKNMPTAEEIAQILLEKDEDVVILRRKVQRLREVLDEVDEHLKP
jgi:hypothetical protein